MNRFMEFLYKVVEMLLVLGHTYVAKGKFSLGQILSGCCTDLAEILHGDRAGCKVPQVDLVWRFNKVEQSN